jgi:hypothetical protein
MWTFMPALTAYHLLVLPCVFALGPVIFQRELGGAGPWAIVVASFGIGTLIGGVISLRVKPARPMLAAAVAFMVCACQPIIVAYGGSLPVIVGLELIAGVAVTFAWTLWDTTLGREIPPHALSRVTSLDWFTTAGVLPIGYAVVGWATGLLGTRATMLVASLVVIGLCAAAVAVGDVRHLRRTQESVAS